MTDKHKTTIRVRYQETDKMGVVYYSNYLVWFEVARTEFFRSKGIVYSELEKKGFFLPVVESHCNYKSPVQYDDTVIIETSLEGMKRSSLKFSYNVIRDGEIACTGYTVHVFVNKDFKPIKMPLIAQQRLCNL